MDERLRLLVDDILDLERIEVDIFRGRSPQGTTQRVFGGQVAAQALAAAFRTLESPRRVHSLHAYFLRPGDPAVPIVYNVARLRDGRSFTNRRVIAVQHGRPIFATTTQFADPEPGLTYQAARPSVAGPDESEPFRTHPGGEDRPDRELWPWGTPIELRRVPGEPQTDRQGLWFRTVGPLPDDDMLHACVLAYVSDMTLLGVTLVPHGRDIRSAALQVASLDHTMWFHAPARPDEWLLYDQVTPWSGGGRGLAQGAIWTLDGRRVATVVQEGLIRTRA